MMGCLILLRGRTSVPLMKAALLNPVRYQLKKDAVRIALGGEPWIFRDHMSTASEAFKDGQWLKLVDTENALVGYGIFEREGLIAIRVLKRGSRLPDFPWIATQVEKAIAKRENVRKYSDAWRALHGENDNLPGVVLDVYGDVGVLQTYSSTVDALGRYVSRIVANRLGLKKIVWKLPAKRARQERSTSRVLRGSDPGLVKFREGKLQLAVQITGSQKSGTFLDLRGLRKWTSMQKWAGKKVLNLFSYTGTVGLAAEIAGAKEIWNVDISEGALEFAKQHHAIDRKKYRFVAADIFEWLNTLKTFEKFDVIIVDPPMMAGRTSRVPKALAAYQKLYRSLLPHLAPRGTMVACCCTSRIPRKRFRAEMDKAMQGLHFRTELRPEEDHPVGFPEGDYLKILVYG